MFRYLCDRLRTENRPRKSNFCKSPGSFADGLGFLHFNNWKNSEQVAA